MIKLTDKLIDDIGEVLIDNNVPKQHVPIVMAYMGAKALESLGCSSVTFEIDPGLGAHLAALQPTGPTHDSGQTH